MQDAAYILTWTKQNKEKKKNHGTISCYIEDNNFLPFLRTLPSLTIHQELSLGQHQCSKRWRVVEC